MEIEEDVLEKLILDIESFTPQTIETKLENKMFELWFDPVLLSNLSGNIGAFFVRAVLNKLNLNEHHLFRWRLENKYRQYQILNHYVPNCMAKTMGFSQVFNENNGIQKIRELCKNGFFVKSTLGHRTGETNTFDRTSELDDIIRVHQEEHDHMEKWVLQKKLNFREEFRIHSFNRDLLYGLTFLMAGLNPSVSSEAELFTQKILEKLPDAILQGTLIGWDIGITDTNEYYVIETNVTGFHPEFCPGFQTSGFFGDSHCGPILCAWFNNYFRNKYQTSIGSIEPSLLSSNQFFKKFMFYESIFNSEHIEILRNKKEGNGLPAVIYLGENPNDLLMKLLDYFEMIDFAKMYYLIVNEEHLLIFSNLYAGDDLIKVIAENTMFTKDDYELVKQLTYEERKEKCCSAFLSLIKKESDLHFVVI